MKIFKNFTDAFLAGLSIAIGGAVYLSLDNKAVGALFFTVGLFAVVTRGFALYTGRVAYVFDNKPSYALSLIVIWFGNLAGAMAAGYALRATRLTSLVQKAQEVCNVKLSDSAASIFILSVFCNILVYLAVDGFKNNKHEIGKYIGLFMGVAVFIICGFEHCVANMFYFSAANVWSAHTVYYLLIMTIGNTVGALLIPLLTKLSAMFKTSAAD